MLVDIGLSRSECAAWVQAWGSIGAIVAAVVGLLWQLNRQRKQSIDKQIDEAKLISTLVFQCRIAALQVRAYLGIPGVEPYVQQVFYWLGELRKIDPLAFPTSKVQGYAGRMVMSRNQFHPDRVASFIVPPVAGETHVDARDVQMLIEWAELTELFFSDWLHSRRGHMPSMAFSFGGRTYNPIRFQIEEGDGIPEGE
ncbi:hypothetical protein [Acidovorax sp. Leaf160]|uniref:hypothetical protein n=1 Tax=Acidovorax sp. Leaf160 TaxID=1736280 RepID=UPI0006F441AF|nr:hypothetical protein [Acidovorax sp. Leaf160]KQR55657.1 hypothetical protein ASF94_04465 [Acidovorax sp. Leaf160]